MTAPAKVSCLIPLYKSRRFLDIVQANVDAHLELDAEVIVSDRHQLDDAARALAERYASEPRVLVITATDSADWVENINSLIARSRAQYFRIVPHDDTASAASTGALLEALESNPDAILAYGVVKALDLKGNRVPSKDKLYEDESRAGRSWDLESALSLYWSGRYKGAFKGLVRAGLVRKHNLYIKKTATLAYSERAWLFGLALAGRFHFVPESALLKRYYPASTHRSWRVTPETIMDSAETMCDYCRDLIADVEVRQSAISSLLLNARRRAEWRANPQGARPAYVGTAT